jgi:hypothetical protein
MICLRLAVDYLLRQLFEVGQVLVSAGSLLVHFQVHVEQRQKLFEVVWQIDRSHT